MTEKNLFLALLTILYSLGISFPFFFGNFWTFLLMVGVAVNDACAYFIGRHFGKHPLSKLSPKKTLEGYFGACIATILTVLLFTKAILTYHEADAAKETPNNIGINIGISAPSSILTHAFVISAFMSTISPLIGLHFSAIKRCLKKKDFANTLGPHGGFFDRFDSCIVSVIFTFFYLSFAMELNDWWIENAIS